MKEFTARNAAKFVVTAIVKKKASDITEDIIADYTRFEEDDMVVEITGTLVGWYIGDKVKPVTDKMVDKTADFISAKWQQMKDKKEETPEEK